MYVDEVGNPGLKCSADPNHRYLSLTGVIVGLNHVRDALIPAFDELKRRYFLRDPGRDPDQKIIFHRKDLMQRLYPFDVLMDQAVSESFDAEMLALLSRLDYVVVTAVIDKLEHQNRYRWAAHPYHYCLEILLERYTRWLSTKRTRGDVMAEARGKREDKALSGAFENLLKGTDYIDRSAVERCITSKKLKLKRKSDNIAGLQLADIIAHPSARAMRLARDGLSPPDDFGSKVVEILEASKYRRSVWGKIDGFGRKWLP